MRDLLRRGLARLRRLVRSGAPPARFDGFEPAPSPTPLLDRLNDAQLEALNELLPWRAFTVDGRGRRFGQAAWAGKRTEPQRIPDRRIELLHERLDLSDRHVLEVGCFEGIHTVGLARLARAVTAIDARVDNVVKTAVRAAFYGCHPTVFVCNVEEPPLPRDLVTADVAHHVGVLYHLRDPVRHLLELGPLVRDGILLDTHYALDHQAALRYEVDGTSYPYQEYREGGPSDPFSGLYPRSKWLPLDVLCQLVGRAGFRHLDVVERRSERHGPRVLLLARRGA